MKWAKKAYILYVSRHGGRETAVRGIPVRAGLGAGAPLQGRNWGQGWGVLATLKHNMEKLITQYKIPTLSRTNNKNFIHSWEISLRSDLETTFLKF